MTSRRVVRIPNSYGFYLGNTTNGNEFYSWGEYHSITRQWIIYEQYMPIEEHPNPRKGKVGG